MKTWTTLAAFLVLGVAAARAADDDKVATLRGDIELSQLERDVDKDLLREALTLAGRARMGLTAKRPETDEAKKRYEAELVTLNEFIQGKKDAIVKRTAELKAKTSELTALEKSSAVQRMTRPRPAGPPPDDKDRQGLIEQMEEAQVEAQLLQMQSQMYQQTLNQALKALATAEFAASNDETQRDKVDAERKRFNKVRANFVEFSKKLRLEQEKVAELRTRLGLNGMGGFQ